MNRPATSSPPESTERPWWRQPMVWLVIGGPLAVVVAAIATAVVAIRGADPVVSQGSGSGGAERPAVQARNQGAVAPSASRP